MIIIDKETLAAQLGWMYQEIVREMEIQYPDQNLELIRASSGEVDDIYTSTEMCFTIPSSEDVLFVVTLHNQRDNEDGFIDEFFEENKMAVLGWIDSHEQSLS